MPRLFPLLTETYRYYMKKVKDVFATLTLVSGIPISFDFNSPKSAIEFDFTNPQGILEFDFQLIERKV